MKEIGKTDIRDKKNDVQVDFKKLPNEKYQMEEQCCISP
jgi:hypothetical protein